MKNVLSSSESRNYLRVQRVGGSGEDEILNQCQYSSGSVSGPAALRPGRGSVASCSIGPSEPRRTHHSARLIELFLLGPCVDAGETRPVGARSASAQ